MGKKGTARKIRRHPELLNEIFSSAGPSQINWQYSAASDDLPELLKMGREDDDGQEDTNVTVDHTAAWESVPPEPKPAATNPSSTKPSNVRTPLMPSTGTVFEGNFDHSLINECAR